jgi:1-acyl-sn-glycerol-3-phosphate acyltransferase
VTTVLVYLWAPVANLLWYVYTIVMAILSLALWPFDRTGELQHWCARWWCRLVAWTIFARIHVHGVEHVQRGRPYVYMANHASIMAKKSLFNVPFMGWHLRTAGHFPIDHGNPRKTATSVRRVIEGVRTGRSLAVFPEGKRTDDGQLQPFQPGAFKIALKAGVPIVPVTIRGTFTLLPRTSLAPRPGRVDVIISEPIETKDYDEKTLPALIERTRAAIAAHL